MAERIDQLIDAWQDGLLDAAGRQELADLLAASPSARRAWWSAVQLSASLREQLNEVAGSRSALRLRSRPRARRSRLPWILACAAALLVATGLLAREAAERSPLPKLSLGEAVDERGVAMARGMPLAGRWLTGTGATLRWADGSVLELAAGSEIVAPSAAAPLRLLRGEASATVEPHPASAPFRIAAGQALITVLGTRFTVHSGEGGCQLRVARGVVRLSVAGRDELVAAGEARDVAIDADASVRVLLVAGDGSAASPGVFPTLQAACDAARSGEGILLLPGVHRAGGDQQALALLHLRSPPSRPLRVVADPGAVVEVGGWNGLVLVGAEGVELRGLDIRGVGDLGGNGVLLRQSRDIAIVGCTLRGLGGSGLDIAGGSHLRIEDCVITGCGGRSHHGQGGIDLQDLASPDPAGGVTLVVRRNRVSGSLAGPENLFAGGQVLGGHGIAIRLPWLAPLASAGPALLIEDNRLDGNAGCGLLLDQGHAARVSGNRLADNMRLRTIDGAGDLTLTDCSAADVADNRIVTRRDRSPVVIVQPDAPAAPTRCTGNLVSGGDAGDLPAGFRREAGGGPTP